MGRGRESEKMSSQDLRMSQIEPKFAFRESKNKICFWERCANKKKGECFYLKMVAMGSLSQIYLL
jgi:hypothetical protein